MMTSAGHNNLSFFVELSPLNLKHFVWHFYAAGDSTMEWVSSFLSVGSTDVENIIYFLLKPVFDAILELNSSS